MKNAFASWYIEYVIIYKSYKSKLFPPHLPQKAFCWSDQV